MAYTVCLSERSLELFAAGTISIIDTPITKINAITIGINLLTLIAYGSDLLKGYGELVGTNPFPTGNSSTTQSDNAISPLRMSHEITQYLRLLV